MLHPIMIGIVTFNTSLTIIYWSFLLGGTFFDLVSQGEDKPKKLSEVTPA